MSERINKWSKEKNNRIQLLHKQLNIQRLKASLTYNHYLQYLRKCTYKRSKNKQIVQEESRNRFHIVSKQIMGKFFGKNQKQQKFSEIKIANQPAQQTINDQVQKISVKMQQNLQNDLKNLHIDLNRKKNQEYSRKEQLLSFDRQSNHIKQQKQFQSEGVCLNLLNSNYSNKIRALAFKNQFYDVKGQYIDDRKQQSLVLHSNIKFENKGKKKFKKGDSDYRFLTNIEQIEGQKQNIEEKNLENYLKKVKFFF